MSVQGRDLLTGKPKQGGYRIAKSPKAQNKSIQRIEDAIMETLSRKLLRVRHGYFPPMVFI